MKAKYARLIRIGINARCIPYTSIGGEIGTGTGFDNQRQLEHNRARRLADSELTERAYRRTKPWVSRRLGAR
jgi:hypothetical protein